MISGSLTGVSTTLKAIGKAKKEKAIKVDEGLEKCAHVILKKSQYYCPVATGKLKASGKVETNGKSGMGARSSVVYDDPKAVFVHERIELKHASPTSAKFLEKAVRETRGTCGNIMKRELEIGGNV